MGLLNKTNYWKALLLVFCLISLSSWSSYTASLEKKIYKLIGKTWKGQTIEKVNVDIPSDMLINEANEVFILKEGANLIGYLSLNKSYSCRVGGCAVWTPNVGSKSNYDPFYYVIISNPDLSIKKVEIIEYFSDYGYEITNKKWLAQFIGLFSGNLTYEDDIDGISGATISVKSLIEDVNENGDLLAKLLSDNLISSVQ